MRDMLVKKQREKVNIVSKIQKHIKNKDWSCIIDGCSEKAINSHLLQRHGVLSEICNDRNKFYEIRTTNANKWSVNNLTIQFKLVGINEAISVPLFCRTHDTALFAEIEQNRIDFSNYRHQLLFCKRTAYSEIRKKEIANELYKRLLDAVNFLLLFMMQKYIFLFTTAVQFLGSIIYQHFVCYLIPPTGSVVLEFICTFALEKNRL